MFSFIKNLFVREKPYQNVNRLEELLELAAENSAYRPDFYRQLFHFRLFVVGQLVNEKSSLNVWSQKIEEYHYASVYTSLEAITYAQRKKKEGVPYVEVGSLELFEMLADSELGIILNGDMDYGRVFSAEEVKDMLNDENSSVESKEFQAGMTAKVGIPEPLPTAVVEAFCNLVVKVNYLQDVFFGLKETEEDSSYLAVLKLEEGFEDKAEALVQDIGVILQELSIDLPVDMTLHNEFYQEMFDEECLLSCAAIIAQDAN